MRIRIANISRTKISADKLEELSFVLYLCIPLLSAIVSTFYSTVAVAVAIIIAYFPLAIACAKKRMVFDFWGLYIFLLLFLLLTYILNPGYEEWFARETYGVWDYVLRPDNGIYIYLFIRILNSPKRIIKCIREAGWIMLVYYGYRSINAVLRGYWIDTSNKGYEIRMSYNLGLGYHVLFLTLVFLFCALENKEMKSWFASFVGVAIIMVAGSRGPFLCILIFFALYFGVKLINSKKKVLYLVGFMSAALILWMALPYLLEFLIQLLDAFNLPSRLIKKLAEGSISDDSRRHLIWNATIQMIKNNPLGYGAMGSRHVLSRYVYAGYPHQIFLEILVDFGVVAGAIIIISMAVSSFRIFTMKRKEDWRGLFIVFFSNACQLLLSLTYWHTIGLWGVLAVGVCIYSSQRRSKRQNVEYQD